MNFTHIIFKAFDLPQGVTSTPKFITLPALEIYYCVSDELTPQLLSQDQLAYLAMRQKKAIDRRVAFILEREAQVIVMMEYKDIDPFVRDYLLNSLNETSNRNEQAFIAKQKDRVKRLYQRIHCSIVTTASDPKALSQQFVPLLQTMYPACKIEVHPVYTDQHREIAFTEYVLQLFTATQVKTLNIQSAYTSYQMACAKRIQNSLIQWQTLYPFFFEKINKLLTTLLKYDVILKQRASLTLSTQPTIAQLEALQIKDQLFKKMIYRSPIKEIQPYLKDLSLTILMALVVDESIDHWIATLKGFRQQQLNQLKSWEQAVQDAIEKQKQHYRNYILWLGKKVWDKVYQHSFIGLGAECSQWLTQQVLDTKTGADRFKLLQKLTRERIDKSHILQLTKVLGAVPGSLYFYAAGGYGLIRTLGSSLLAEQLKLFLGDEKINDKKASVLPPSLPLPSVLNFTRIVQILLALFEAVFFQNYHFLGQAIGGLTGSICTIELIKRFIPSLQTAPAEQQIILLLFFSLCGSEIGSLIANVVCDGIDKLSTRALLEKALCEKVAEKGYIGCVIDYSKQSINSFSFWFSKRDTLRLSLTKKEYYETICQVTNTGNENYLVECEPSVVTTVKRLQY